MGSPSVYLASPLFNEGEKAFNVDLTRAIEGLHFTVFLPQRDGFEFASLEGTPAERDRRIFDLDVAMVESAATIVAILDGVVPDEGVMVELGIAREQSKLSGRKKLILGLKTDRRTWLGTSQLNPMVQGTLDHLFDSKEALLAFMAENSNEVRGCEQGSIS